MDMGIVSHQDGFLARFCVESPDVGAEEASDSATA
jgi:hypothetical protein